MDEQQFIQFIKGNQGVIYKVCNIYSETQEDFEDLQQEIIYQVWKSISGFTNKSKLSTWLYRVALDTALNFRRKIKIPTIDIETKAFNLIDTSSEKQFEEKTRWLYKAIHQLNNLERAIILLYLEEKSYKEISEISGFPEKQIGMKISRIKTKLQHILEPIFND